VTVHRFPVPFVFGMLGRHACLMAPLLPAALTPADLPVAELSSARLDGEVFVLAGSWCPVDSAAGPLTRAAAVAHLAPGPAVAERMTAAWIYGLVPEPEPHEFCVDIRARTHKPTGPAIRLREVRIQPADISYMGELPVTSHLRTAVDLARWGGLHGRSVETAVLARLLAAAESDLSGSGVRASLQGIPFSRIARQRLADAFALLGDDYRPAPPTGSAVADPVDVVDRVDAAHRVQHPVEMGGVAHLEHEPADRQPVT